MGEIVNLRRARKARTREAAAAEADANRLRHGRTAPEKAAEAALARRLDRVLDGARLDRDGEAGE